MKLGLTTAYSRSSPTTVTLISGNPHARTTSGLKFSSSFRLISGYKISSFSLSICSSKSSSAIDSAGDRTETYNQTVDGEISSTQVTESLNVEVGIPKILPSSPPKLSLSDKAFFLLAFIACTVLLIKFSMFFSFFNACYLNIECIFLVEKLSVFFLEIK